MVHFIDICDTFNEKTRIQYIGYSSAFSTLLSINKNIY
nr:MAG TPA: hypothetical protein [Caudoviricetes sp.]